RRCARLAATGKVPAQQLPGMAIHHQGQCEPAVTPIPDTAQVGGPALIRCCRHGWQCLDPRSKANGPLAYLPAAKLEDALDSVLVHAQKASHRAVAKGGLLLNQRL